MKTRRPLDQVLSDYHPRPGESFFQRMKTAPWNPKAHLPAHRPNRQVRFARQFAVGLAIVIALLTFSIPSVRAALTTWLGLSIAPSNQMPAAAVTLVGGTPSPSAPATPDLAVPSLSNSTPTVPTPTQPATSRPAEVEPLSAQVPWTIVYPAQLPEGYHLASAYWDTNHQMLILTFLSTRPLPDTSDPLLTVTRTITLLQAQRNDFIPMQIAPATIVENVMVKDLPAVYAVGAWDTEFVPDVNAPNGGTMVSTWRNDLQIHNLYWQVGNVYLALLTDDDALNQPGLIQLAASMQ